MEACTEEQQGPKFSVTHGLAIRKEQHYVRGNFRQWYHGQWQSRRRGGDELLLRFSDVSKEKIVNNFVHKHTLLRTYQGTFRFSVAAILQTTGILQISCR